MSPGLPRAIAALGALLSLAACPGSIQPPPSRFNGVWASLPSSAGVREGILVYELRDGGVVWSPLNLVLDDGGITLRHHCRDFSVDAMSGRVVAVRGVSPAGEVLEADAGFDFIWTASVWPLLNQHLDLRSAAPLLWDGGPGVALQIWPTSARIHGTVTTNDGSLRFEVEYLADASVVVDGEVRHLAVSRQLACK